MLGKLKTLLLLATIIAQSLSTPTVPPNAATSDPGRPNPLEELAKELHMTVDQFKCAVKKGPFVLDNVLADFSSKLTDIIMKDEKTDWKNIVFSPYSIHLVLTMVMVGAQKDTPSRQQMIDALAYRSNEYAGKCLFNYRRVLDDYKREDTDIEQADRVFIRKGFPIHPTYNIFTQGFFGNTAGALDVDPDEAANEINNYVDLKTNGMIKKLMLPGSIPPNAVMVVVDAISHVGEWLFMFGTTSPMTFNLLGGQTSFEYAHGMVMAPNKDLQYLFSQQLDSQILELPYKNPNIRMYIVLPNINTWEGLKKAATGFRYEDVKHDLRCFKQGIKVTMPRLKTTFHKDLVHTIESLGMKDIFDERLAKLSYISRRALKLTKVVHQAGIEVNAEGSTASAASAAVACTRDAFSGPIDFKVNRPFFLSIVDIWFGIPLFNGVILDPSQQGIAPDGDGASP